MNNILRFEELVDKIGFGCGRLVGGTDLKKNIDLLVTAKELGINHFDTAPSYGLGTAEKVIGYAFLGDPSISIATKVGISRPKGAGLLSEVKRYVSPLLNRSILLKESANFLLKKTSKRNIHNTVALESSLFESLSLMKRDRVNYLFYHEGSGILDLPHVVDFFFNAAPDSFDEFGVATNVYTPPILDFGTVRQTGFSFELSNEGLRNTKNFTHGIMKNTQIDSSIDSELSRISVLCPHLSIRDVKAALKIIHVCNLPFIDKVILSFKDKANLVAVFSIVKSFCNGHFFK